MNFIDIFSGLGCFHQSLKALGHKCVYACEIDKTLNDLYQKNWNIKADFDIRDVDLRSIPKHQLLCAGFPCQPFSQATPKDKQLGLTCPKNGDLFNKIVEILRLKKPKFFILENVPYLLNHNKGKTWKTIERKLKSEGYTVDKGVFSPDQFGIPQSRRRLFIIGNRSGTVNLPLPTNELWDIGDFIDDKPSDARYLSPKNVQCLEVWQEFVEKLPFPLPSPVWSREFGASYPFKMQTPESYAESYGITQLQKWRGNHGKKLSEVSEQEVWDNIPTYAKRGQDIFPKWKILYIDTNRIFYRINYEKDKKWFKEWIQKISEFPPTWQRLEWNCGDDKKNLWNQIIQFRNSGIRVSRTDKFPTLVVNPVQVPILAWENRYLTPRECARLQSIDDKVELPKIESNAFKAIGNAVNVKVVSEVAKALLNQS